MVGRFAATIGVLACAASVGACYDRPSSGDAAATLGGSSGGSSSATTSPTTTAGSSTTTSSPTTSSTSAGTGTTTGPMLQCGDGTPVAGELCFGPYQGLPALSRQFGIDAGDFDGDGVGDLVVGEFDANQIRVYLGGPGGPTLGVQALAMQPFSARVAQLAGGSGLDLAYARQGGIGFMVGDGAGGFANPVEVAVGMTVFDLAAGDINGDGVDDLVMADLDRDIADVLLADGLGGVVGGPAIQLTPGLDGLSVVIADFDGNGFGDVAHLVSGGGTLQAEVRAGNGTGAFGPPAIFGGITSANGIAAGDFDGDGAADLVILEADSARVVFDPLDAASQTVMLAASSAWNATAGDIDGDGRDDLAVARRFEDQISIFASQANRSFATPVELTVVAGGEPARVAVADLDGDGGVDVAAALAAIPAGETAQIGLFFSDP